MTAVTGAELLERGFTRLVPELYDEQVRMMAETAEFRGKRSLELGARDGRHSVAALELGAREAVAVDGRDGEFGKDRRVCYVKADAALIECANPFEIVMCYGLLYHVQFPAALLTTITASCTEWLFLSTHCGDDMNEHEGYKGQWRIEGNDDIDALAPVPSFWLTEESLLRAIDERGFSVQKIHHYDISNQPAVWIAARRRAE